MAEMTRRSNYNLTLRKRFINKITAETKKWLYKMKNREKPTDSPKFFFIRSSI